MNRLNFKILSLSFVSLAFANQINVASVDELVQATLNSKAGDTIWVAPGKYELSTSLCTNDKFVNNTGRDCGLLWLGTSGTASNPVVLAGADPTSPPEIYSSDFYHNYGIHVTGDYVILKNLKIHHFAKGVVFDNSVGSVMEDCEVYYTGGELVHVRDSSQNVILNRNYIYGSGYDNPQYGEGFYVGTYHTGWASSQQSDKDAGFWGSAASQHRYSGYDWRVNGTKITCNVVKSTTAENVDVKEGTINGIVQGNMFVGDWLNYDGTVDHDDANIDMKGTSWSVTGNYFYNSKKEGLLYYNSKFRYFVEEVVMRGDNVKTYEDSIGYYVTADKYAQTGWCDNSTGDKNDCVESKNNVVEELREVRNDCEEIFKIPGKAIVYSDSALDSTDSSLVTPSVSSSSNVAVSSSSSSEGNVSYKTVRYEAEDAECTGTSCEKKTHAEASAGYYVRTVTDCDITFSVEAPTAGTYGVVIRFSNTASNAKTQDIYVNGSKVQSQEFPVTLEGNLGGAAAAFESVEVQVSLKAGTNTFAIKKSWGHVDVDYIEITVPISSSNISFAGIFRGGFQVQTLGRTIQVSGLSSEKQVSILDLQGRVLYSGNTSRQNSFEFKVNRPGMFLVRVGSRVKAVNVQ